MSLKSKLLDLHCIGVSLCSCYNLFTTAPLALNVIAFRGRRICFIWGMKGRATRWPNETCKLLKYVNPVRCVSSWLYNIFLRRVFVHRFTQKPTSLSSLSMEMNGSKRSHIFSRLIEHLRIKPLKGFILYGTCQHEL